MDLPRPLLATLLAALKGVLTALLTALPKARLVDLPKP